MHVYVQYAYLPIIFVTFSALYTCVDLFFQGFFYSEQLPYVFLLHGEAYLLSGMKNVCCSLQINYISIHLNYVLTTRADRHLHQIYIPYCMACNVYSENISLKM